MKKNSLSRLVFPALSLASLLAASASTFAGSNKEGPGVSGGGNVKCIEYTGLVASLSRTLFAQGQASLTAVDSFIGQAEYESLKTVGKYIMCEPVAEIAEKKSAGAYSFAVSATNAKPLTKLKVGTDSHPAGWAVLDAAAKVRLAIHEIMVLSAIESDDVYNTTDKLIPILSKLDPSLKNMTLSEYGSSVITNPNGSVTIFAPKKDGVRVGDVEFDWAYSGRYDQCSFPINCWYHKSGHYSPGDHSYYGPTDYRVSRGFCRFLGFTDIASDKWEKNSRGNKYARFEANGNYLGVQTPSSTELINVYGYDPETHSNPKTIYLESVTCIP